MRQPLLLLAVLAPALFAPELIAQDARGSFTPVKTLIRAAHSGDSPFDPPLTSDHLFVTDTGGGLDTGCSYRSDGPLRIQVPITRVVGATKPDGTLQDPQSLVAAGVVSAFATLVMPAYDIDFDTPIDPPDQPERDQVLLNGKDIGSNGSAAFLTGTNNVWKLNEFRIPIALVKFGTRQPGGKPAPGMNEILINIDIANAGINEEDWCAAIDWAYIRFEALAPVIMVHGNNSSGGFFDGIIDSTTSVAPGVTQAFQDAKIPYDNSITMATDYISVHQGLLMTLIPQKAAEFGAHWVHLLAHSKGGLDSRAFLADPNFPPNFGVLSLTTLSTPHRGSTGPDYQIDAVDANSAFSDDTTRTRLAQETPPDRGTFNLRVAYVEAFNQRNIPMLPKQFTVDGETRQVQYRAIGADANLDNSTSLAGNPTISYDETRGTPGQGSHFDTTWAYVLEQVYRIIGGVASTRVEDRTVGGVTVKVVRETPAGTFRLNDFCVSLFSSQIDPFVTIQNIAANHSTISNPAVGTMVINSIKSIQPIQ